MRALVTGVAGFVGSTLASRLLCDGHEVIGVDSISDYYSPHTKVDNLERLSCNRFHFVQGDLNELSLAELLLGVDTVFHQAGQPGVRASWGETFPIYTRANVDATQRLLDAARDRGGLTRFVYASSSSVYGDAERYPTRETDCPEPISPYGVTKLAAEHLVTLYGRQFGVPTTSLRYFTVYGPRQRPDMAFTRFARAILNEDEINVFGDGEQIRDFTYVDDVVEANVACVDSALTAGSVFNVSGGSSVSVNEVVAVLGDLCGRQPHVRYRPTALGDVRRTGGDSTLFRQATGWRPATTLRDGLDRQVAWAARTLLPATA